MVLKIAIGFGRSLARGSGLSVKLETFKSIKLVCTTRFSDDFEIGCLFELFPKPATPREATLPLNPSMSFVNGMRREL